MMEGVEDSKTGSKIKEIKRKVRYEASSCGLDVGVIDEICQRRNLG